MRSYKNHPLAAAKPLIVAGITHQGYKKRREKMNRKMVIATLLSFVTVLNAMALNWETASGSDIVRENAAKEEGFTDAQLQNICKRLGNREIEFVNGKVEEVSRDGESGVVTMLVEFSDPAAGEFASTLSVEVLLTGEMAKQAESLDNGTKIPSIRGYLTYDKDFFCNIQLKNVSFALPKSAKKTNVIDLNKVTGADIVHENATKEHGYSESQLRKLCESLKGRSLEFENGKVNNVYKCHDGTVTMLVSFSDSGRHRMFSHDLSIDAILDGEMAKLAETLDRETKILKLSGNVFYDPDSISFSFMKLENVVFTPEASALNKSVVDYSKATGPQLVAENASKKGGYSDAQFSNICRLLDGREITFTNGIVEDVSKDTRTGGTTLRVDFKQPGTSGFSPTIRVSAHLAESVERKVEALDKGTLIASLTGNVAYDSSSTHSMTLNKAMLVVDLTETAEMTFDPDTVTGADIVKANAAKEDGFSKAQLASICKQLKGRVLTFENVEIRSVSKDKRRDSIRVLLSASTTPGGRRLTFWAYVSGDMAAEVEKLDIGTKVKRVRGTVSYDSSFNIANWFNLFNASFDLWQDSTMGDGMTKDLSEAVNKFRKSDELGDVNAQKSLGIYYDKGEGAVAEKKAAEEKAAAEKLKETIEEEKKKAQDGFDEILRDLKRIDWERCTKHLTRLKESMTTHEGKDAAEDQIKKVQFMEGMHKYFIKHAEKFVFRDRRGTVLAIVMKTDDKTLTILKAKYVKGKPVPDKEEREDWSRFYDLKERVYLNYMNQFINELVLKGRERKRISSPREWSEHMLGAALTLHYLYGEEKGVDKFIPELVKKAVKDFEPCRKWAIKWFPEVELEEPVQ